ncbi:MAG: hypoxanthine phosphoribosyltransferase [Desulfobulbaceae bacterium]|nr:hypoxanthine phosphoribosyltransferase [Desulfobulbaceae bacterium]
MTGKQDILLSKKRIDDRVKELAKEISLHYKDKNLVVVGILNGAFIFLSDLVRSMSVEHRIDFIRVSSYGKNTSSSGIIQLTKDVELEVKGQDVLLVEDIVDTGNTLSWLQTHFADKEVASLKICSFINKKERRVADVEVDYYGFDVDKGFLVGYGLDYNEQYRYLPHVSELNLD